MRLEINNRKKFVKQKYVQIKHTHKQARQETTRKTGKYFYTNENENMIYEKL